MIQHMCLVCLGKKTIDLSTLARHDFQWARIGYTIHNRYWRNGYGEKAVIELAFNELAFHRIEAHINLDNTQSNHLAENGAFIFEFEEWTDDLVCYINSYDYSRKMG